jgi:hypothetical protein
LQNHEEVLEKFFQFKSSKIDAIWHKILIYDVPIAEFASNSGMELLQKEIETFNPELKLAIRPRWISTERTRNSGKMHATAVITFDNEQMARLAMARKIFLAGQQIRTAKYYETKATDQCSNCQKFGHMAKFCKNDTTYQTYAEYHGTMDCINDIIKCANCGENHRANHKECIVWKEAVENLNTRRNRNANSTENNIEIDE